MAGIYIINSGNHSDYSIVSVLPSKEVAEEKLQTVERWTDVDGFRVEEYPLDESHDSIEFEMARGFKVFYDFKKHGFHVNNVSVVFEKALYQSSQNVRVIVSSTFVTVSR